MDSGLWISWYDLPEDGRDAYLAWLHGTYLPGLLKRRGYLWAAHYATVTRQQRPLTQREAGLNRTDDASLPRGNQYILLVAAEHAHVFGDPVPSALHAALPEHERKMLALRSGERVNIMTEVARVHGPAAAGYGPEMAPGPCIQLGNFNSAWRDEEEMLAWYAQGRMPAMETLPGMIRTRRYASIAGWSKHIILYEFVTLEARNQYFPTHEDSDPKMRAWSDRVVPTLIHAPGSSAVACRIWPPA